MFTSSIKRCNRRFWVIVVQWTLKKYTKKHDACAEHSFAHKTNYCVLMFSLLSSSWLLKLPCAWWLPLTRLSWLLSALVGGSLSLPRLKPVPGSEITLFTDHGSYFMRLSLTHHSYYLRAWNRVVQAPFPNPSIGHRFDTWKYICCRLICFLGQSILT